MVKPFGCKQSISLSNKWSLETIAPYGGNSSFNWFFFFFFSIKNRKSIFSYWEVLRFSYFSSSSLWQLVPVVDLVVLEVKLCVPKKKVNDQFNFISKNNEPSCAFSSFSARIWSRLSLSTFSHSATNDLMRSFAPIQPSRLPSRYSSLTKTIE